MPKKTGKTLSDFRSTHDSTHRVRAAIIKGLRELGPSWEYEGEFMKRCGLGSIQFGAYRDEFMAAHVVVPPGRKGTRQKRVWCGTAAFATKLRKVLNK